MEIINCIQGSDEWFAAKLGVISASNFDKVLSKGSGRTTYMKRILIERRYGIKEDTFVNDAMLRGIELEQEALQAYANRTGVEIQRTGFMKLNDWVGCSPDGLIGSDGLIEVKCPLATTHLWYIADNKLPAPYKSQVQGQLYVTGRQWCDFISYHPECNKVKDERQ